MFETHHNCQQFLIICFIIALSEYYFARIKNDKMSLIIRL